MNKYWIPHKDIHKKVIMTHIQFYLGADATVRSYTKDVSALERHGFYQQPINTNELFFPSREKMAFS